MILLTISTLLAFWFAVSVYGYTSANAVNLSLSLNLQYFFAFATFPLYFEAAVEVTYPVPEGMLSSYNGKSLNYCDHSKSLHVLTGSSAAVINTFSCVATLIFQVSGCMKVQKALSLDNNPKSLYKGIPPSACSDTPSL